MGHTESAALIKGKPIQTVLNELGYDPTREEPDENDYLNYVSVDALGDLVIAKNHNCNWVDDNLLMQKLDWLRDCYCRSK